MLTIKGHAFENDHIYGRKEDCIRDGYDATRFFGIYNEPSYNSVGKAVLVTGTIYARYSENVGDEYTLVRETGVYRGVGYVGDRGMVACIGATREECAHALRDARLTRVVIERVKG